MNTPDDKEEIADRERRIADLEERVEVLKQQVRELSHAPIGGWAITAARIKALEVLLEPDFVDAGDQATAHLTVLYMLQEAQP